MTCREIVELLTEYVEGALPADRRARVEAHLSGCAGCTAFLEQLRTTVRLVGHLADEALPRALEADLLDAFRTWHRA